MFLNSYTALKQHAHLILFLMVLKVKCGYPEYGVYLTLKSYEFVLKLIVNFIKTILNRPVKNVMSAGKTRQNPTKKRSLCFINEHFEVGFNAVLSYAIVFQPPVNEFAALYR